MATSDAHYSQGREEEILLDVLKATKAAGHFLDIGAYDGRVFSNTLRLAELGWSGVCVEPSPTVFPALLKLHGSNPGITLIQAAVCAAPGFIDFYDSGGDALSTTHVPHKEKWEAGYSVAYARMLVYAIDYAALFKQVGYAFDFINLDVEGLSADMLFRLPLNSLERLRCLCVEHDGKLDDIVTHTARFGFGYVFHNGENVILTR